MRTKTPKTPTTSKTRKTISLTISLLLVACLACASKGDGADASRATPSPAAQQSPAPTPPQSATCRMLSSEDVREVQGEAPQDAQGSEHLAGGLSMSQCLYRLPTFGKSVNVEVVRAAEGSSADALKQFWRDRFHPEAVEARERERERKEERERERGRMKERERASGQVREGGHEEEEREGEEEESRPRRVKGLGDEAYWSGNQMTAALSVLSKNAVVRVSVGGPETPEEKIKRASALARKLLKRL
jgi:hypothetical protein